MYSSIEERILQEAEYLVENNSTVRKTAEKFGVSKSTVHKDVSYKLYYLDERLYVKVKKILSFNLAERHMRGGIATRQKYMLIKETAKCDKAEQKNDDNGPID